MYDKGAAARIVRRRRHITLVQVERHSLWGGARAPALPSRSQAAPSGLRRKTTATTAAEPPRSSTTSRHNHAPDSPATQRTPSEIQPARQRAGSAGTVLKKICAVAIMDANRGKRGIAGKFARAARRGRARPPIRGRGQPAPPPHGRVKKGKVGGRRASTLRGRRAANKYNSVNDQSAREAFRRGCS